MASWKKVIVSGSQAHLAAVTASSAVLVGTNQIISSSAAATILSGSFSGSFTGDGGGLSNITPTFPGTQLTPIIDTTKVFINDGANKYATVSQFTSASWAGIGGDVVINGSGTATIQANSVALGTDTTGNYVASVTNGIGIDAIAAAGEGSAVTITVSGSSTLSTNKVTKWTGNAFANSLITDDGATVTVAGNLTVNGTTITVATENLTVSDKFILLASGSTTNVDGGIIVSNAPNNTGSAFYYDGDSQRWAVAPALASNATTATPNSFLVTVSGSTTDPGGNPFYGALDTSRIGAMYVNTTTQDIWIWS